MHTSIIGRGRREAHGEAERKRRTYKRSEGKSGGKQQPPPSQSRDGREEPRSQEKEEEPKFTL